MDATPAMTAAQDWQLTELKETVKGVVGDRLKGFVLYGSRARGDYQDESDTDIAIIVAGLTREMKNQILDRVADWELKYLRPISALVLSQHDFDHLKRRERGLALDIEKEGVPL